MDSDLADAVEALKAIFQRRKIDSSWGKAAPELVDELKKQLKLPLRYRNFLLKANPTKVETATPVERVRLLPAEEIAKSQPNHPNWKPNWVVIGESSLLSDPYFLDVSRIDPEFDCPVFTAMSGQDNKWNPTLCASSFAQFLRILSTGMEVAQGFGDTIMDDEDEDNFREAMGPKVKVIDAAALRAGHWT